MKCLLVLLTCWLAFGPVVVAQVETADDLAFLGELELAFRRGGTHSARRDLDEYLEDFPDSVRAHALAATAASRRGECDAALAHLHAAGDPDPALAGRLLLRLGRYEDALARADDDALQPMASLRLRIASLDALGRRSEALAAARAVTRRPDTSGLDGAGLRDLGWVLLFERRFELANQALVFADRELNGLQGNDYEVHDAEVLVLLGRTFQAARQTGSGGGGDRTLDVLNDVLEVDPGDPDALVVKARAYTYANNGRLAQEALARALARDPGHPEALVLRGRGLLLSRQVEPALADAAAVLAVDPRQRDALALRAAALALTTRRDEAQAARDRFAEVHPESSAFHRLLGEVLQSHYRFAESIPELEQALAIDPENEEPLPVLAQSLAHVGREDEAIAALEEHLRRSPFPFPWRHNMLQVLERLGETVELRTESGFVLRLPPGEQEVLGVILPEALDRARADLAQRWGLDPGGDVLVEVFDHHGDFSVRTVGFEGFMALGACFGKVVTLISPLSELRRTFLWRQTAVHEYAHVVTLTLSNQRMPRWLSEGVSVIEEKRVHPWWDRALEREVLDARANGLIVPVERMDELFQDGSTVMLGYYLGSLVCEVIEREYGFDALRDLVVAYAGDRSTGEAVRVALGVDASQLDRQVLAYIDEVVAGRAQIRPRYREAGKDWLRGRALAGDDDAMYELAFAYLDLGRTVDLDAAIERVVASEGESLRVQRLLAERDVAAGRPGRALPRLTAWAAGDDVDADGLALLATLLLHDGEREQAIEQLRRAVDLFPSDVSAEGALARLFSMFDPVSERADWLGVLEALVAHDETALKPRLTLLEQAEEQGRTQRALELSAQIVDIAPYEPAYRLALGRRLADAGLLDEARAQWRLVLGIRPEQLAGSEASDLETLQQEARQLLEGGGNDEEG